MAKRSVGKHSAEINGDIIYVMNNGEWDAADTQEWMKLVAEVRAEHGMAFLINDISAGITMAPEARRIIAAWPRAQQPVASVFTGTNWVTRGLMLLINRAVAIVQGVPPSMYFAASVEEARQIIERERARFRKLAA